MTLFLELSLLIVWIAFWVYSYLNNRTCGHLYFASILTLSIMIFDTWVGIESIWETKETNNMKHSPVGQYKFVDSLYGRK